MNDVILLYYVRNRFWHCCRAGYKKDAGAQRTRTRGLKKHPPGELFEDRRDVGIGILGRWFQYSYKKADELDVETLRKIEDVDVHRLASLLWKNPGDYSCDV